MVKFRTQLNRFRVKGLFFLRQAFLGANQKLISGSVFELDMRVSLDVALKKSGELEPDLQASLEIVRLLELGDGTFLDVGANAGYWTVPLAPNFSRTIAFEPDPDCRSRLVRNLGLNSIHNCTVSEIAVSDSSGPAHFERRRQLDNSGATNDGLGSLVDEGSNIQNTIVVKTEKLDSLLKKWPTRIDMVKIDVEGAEELVLEGFQASLLIHRPVVISEVLFPEGLDKRQVLSKRASFFPGDYCHFYLLGGKLARVKSSQGDRLSDLNMFSIPKENIAALRVMLSRNEDKEETG